MIVQKKQPKAFATQHGTFMQFSWKSFEEIKLYAKNWSHYCQFRYGKNPLFGQFDIYQHEEFQLGIGEFCDGMMFNGHSSIGTVSIVVVMELEGSLNINKINASAGDVFIVDDSEEFEIIFSDRIKIGVLSLLKKITLHEFPQLDKCLNGKLIDRDSNIISYLNSFDPEQGTEKVKQGFYASLHTGLDNQEPVFKLLSPGQIKAFEIRDLIIMELKENHFVKKLATTRAISEKTLQKNFKSLFGVTPKKFIKIMKLNMAHRDLVSSDPRSASVTDIAQKWGFSHLGRFSQEYKMMYGFTPSETLQKNMEKMLIEAVCVVHN